MEQKFGLTLMIMVILQMLESKCISGLSASANPTTLSGSFNIPPTAPLGAHRMRNWRN